MIASCKGYLSEFYLSCWKMPLWELIEAIELVTEAQEEAQAADAAEVDIFESLGL